jgi:tetratricopeptide (TPR) repeat protein
VLYDLCRDEYRLVRIAAAQSLSSIPEALQDKPGDTGYFTALNEYIRSITTRPDDWSSHATLGNFYFNRQDYDNAIRHYNYSTKLFPENVGAYVNCGFVYTLKGNVQQAEAQFRKALAYEPENEGANLNYALLLGEMGRLEEAEKAFSRVLGINPASSVAAYNLSIITSDRNLDEAILFAELAAINDPMNPKYPYTLGYFLYKKKEYPRAEIILKKLTESFRSYGDAYLLLYEVYAQTGKSVEAKQLTEQALSNPELHESYRMRFSQLQMTSF